MLSDVASHILADLSLIELGIFWQHLMSGCVCVSIKFQSPLLLNYDVSFGCKPGPLSPSSSLFIVSFS